MAILDWAADPSSEGFDLHFKLLSSGCRYNKGYGLKMIGEAPFGGRFNREEERVGAMNLSRNGAASVLKSTAMARLKLGAFLSVRLTVL